MLFDTVEIKNFKNFSDVELKGLKRINIIVGQNATGKTALLEALCTVTSNLANTLGRLRSTRTPFLGKNTSPSSTSLIWKLFEDSFHNLDFKNTIHFTLKKEGKPIREFNIAKETNADESISIDTLTRQTTSVLNTTAAASPKFLWRNEKNEETRSVLFASEDGDVIERITTGTKIDALGPAILLPAATTFNVEESTAMFDHLNKHGRKSDILGAFREMFDFISDLEVIDGIIHVTLKNNHSLKLPVPMVSSGFSKILYLLLVFTNVPLVFIDEIENGIHYSKLESLWKAIYASAEKHDLQLFITTHSDECLKALLPILQSEENGKKRIEQTTLVHLSNASNRPKAVCIPGDELTAMIENNFEVRA